MENSVGYFSLTMAHLEGFGRGNLVFDVMSAPILASRRRRSVECDDRPHGLNLMLM